MPGRTKSLLFTGARSPSPHFESALDVLTDILLHSKFDPAEIEKERQVIIEEINMSLDSPAQRVSMLIDDFMWPDQPLGRDIAGTKETVTGINRQMMLDYMAAQYRPQNIVLSVAGAINPAELVNPVSKRPTNGLKFRRPSLMPL